MFAVVIVLVLPSLYRSGMAQAALYNGDEAIYAEMAREMVRSGRPSELSFDGEVLFPRPPGAVWALAAAYRVHGLDPIEPPLRAMNAFLAALAVALTLIFGAILCSPLVGLVGAGLLAFSDLFLGYARVYESEPLLLCCVLLALSGWALRSRAGWLLFGVGLGGALLTKQLVGLLPLIGPIGDRAIAILKRRDEEDVPPRAPGLGLGLGLAFLVAAPWHVLMIARHGAAFLDAYFVRSLLGRASGALLHRTSWTFYGQELLRSEGPFYAPLFLVAALAILFIGITRRRTAELVLGAWALGVIVIFSCSRSRYDYYLLLAYPAFALATAQLLAALPRLRSLVGAALVVLSSALHLPRNLTAQRGDDETRALLASTHALAPGALLYCFARHPYTARIYGDRQVRIFVETERDLRGARAVRETGMPAPAELAQPASRALELAARPSLMIVPRARVDVLRDVAPDRYRVLGESETLRLLYLP